MATVYDTINGYYRQYLGRDATQDEINQQTGYGRSVAPKNLAWAAGQIANSAEAQAYAKRASAAANTPPPTTPPPSTTPNTSTTGAPNQVTNPSSTSSGSGTSTTTGTAPTFNKTGQGGTGHQNYQYTGFDFNQDASNRDTGKSMKYAFADATRQAADAGVSASMWGTKDGAAQFAEQYIRPKLEALGYKILEIKGDKMRVIAREDAEKGNTSGTWVDFVVNAGGANPQLAWQAETAPDATDPTTSLYTATGTDKTTTTTTSAGVPAWFDALYVKHLGRHATKADVDAWGGADKWEKKQWDFETALAGDPASVSFRNGTPTSTAPGDERGPVIADTPYYWTPQY